MTPSSFGPSKIPDEERFERYFIRIPAFSSGSCSKTFSGVKKVVTVAHNAGAAVYRIGSIHTNP